MAKVKLSPYEAYARQFIKKAKNNEVARPGRTASGMLTKKQFDEYYERAKREGIKTNIARTVADDQFASAAQIRGKTSKIKERIQEIKAKETRTADEEMFLKNAAKNTKQIKSDFGRQMQLLRESFPSRKDFNKFIEMDSPAERTKMKGGRRIGFTT